MKGSQVSRGAWNKKRECGVRAQRDTLVTHLVFMGCDHELGLGPGTEDTALN